MFMFCIVTFPKLPLEPTNMKELELQFHTADYHLLTEVALGLRNATEHLSKVGH